MFWPELWALIFRYAGSSRGRRNRAGAMLAASARWKDSMGSALMAEAEAFRDGVWLIPAGTRERIVVESDCLELVTRWKNKGNYGSDQGDS